MIGNYFPSIVRIYYFLPPIYQKKCFSVDRFVELFGLKEISIKYELRKRPAMSFVILCRECFFTSMNVFGFYFSPTLMRDHFN